MKIFLEIVEALEGAFMLEMVVYQKARLAPREALPPYGEQDNLGGSVVLRNYPNP